MFRSIVLFSLTLAALGQQSFSPTIRATPGASPVLYGTYGNSIVRSDDQGATWRPLYIAEAGLSQPSRYAIDADATSDTGVFYVTPTFETGPVWKSTDSGATWTLANSGLPATGFVTYFKQTRGPNQALYLRTGKQLYKSADRATTWKLQSTLPDDTGIVEVSDANPKRIYFMTRGLQVSVSDDEGATWRQTGTVGATPGSQATGLGVLYSDPNTVFAGTSITPIVSETGAYRSINSGANFTQLSNGLTSFVAFFTGQNGPLYAPSATVGGFYRSDDNGNQWKDVSFIGGQLYNLSAIDPKNRRTIYGSRPAPVRSTDGGDTWTAITATITPSIGKPSSLLRLTVEEGAPYAAPLIIQAAEDSSWRIAYTLSVTGAPWLTISPTSGNTPANVALNVSTTGLKPGTYTGTILISAPSSFNKSVTQPVELTVLPKGLSGPRYSVSTVLGNGDANVTRNSGTGPTVAIGSPNALTVDSTGRLLAATDTRLWQLIGTDAGVLAGTGVAGDVGDDGPSIQAQVNAPAGISVDAQSNIFFTETTARRLRKIASGTISTVATTNTPILTPAGGNTFRGLLSPAGLAFDSLNRLTLVDTSGFLRFNGPNFTLLGTQFPNGGPFGLIRPTGMVADSKDNLYITDRNQHYVLKQTPQGALSVVAGTGVAGLSGDGGPATAARLSSPSGLGIDSHDNLYVADAGNLRVRMISANGTIQTIAGTGRATFEGDGGTGSSASFQSLSGLAVDKQGAVYVADPQGARVRKLTPPTAATPTVSGLLHGASGDKTLSPGSLFSLYGTFAVPTAAITSTTPWPVTLANVTVFINGILAPLYYASATQINGQIPYETDPGNATAVVSVNGSLTAQTSFPVVPANPGILVFNGNRAVAVNPNGTVNTPDTPCAPNDIELLYLSGVGQPDQEVATGAGAPSAEPLARVKYAYSITLNGQPVESFYLGLAPGYPALAQANFKIPNLPAGDYPLVVTINGVPSNITILTVH